MFKIELKGLDKLLAALQDIKQNAQYSEMKLPYDAAVSHRDALHQAITSQVFPQAYDALTKKYAAWKQKHGTYTDFWRLFGDLLESLDIWHVTDRSWGSGIIPGSRNRKGRSIEMYASVDEKKRPLFEPILAEIAKNDWKNMTERVLDQLGILWRG